MEREGVRTLSIRSFLRALRCLAHFEIRCALCVLKSIFENDLVRRFSFLISLVSVLKSADKAFENIF